MKVCTDACLFGSLVANKIKNAKINNCLDIGTGTGLLSLMVAQKSNITNIRAIEIDAGAAKQAGENFLLSPWAKRLQLTTADAKSFLFNQQFQFIFSNPPFFEGDLKSSSQERNTALHSTGLNLKELLQVIKTNLFTGGTFAVLLPFHRTAYFEALCSEQGFYCNQKVLVRQTPRHNYFRSILFFSQENTSARQKEIVIQVQPGQYADEFKDLLRDYYLNVDEM